MASFEPIIPPGHERAYAAYGFAPAVRVGDHVYVSGVIGRDADGRVPADADAEFDAAFAGLGAVLAAAGASLADVVDLTTFHTDMARDIATFMQVKHRWMHEPYPAWTAIGCTALAAPGARAEIKATAVMRSREP